MHDPLIKYINKYATTQLTDAEIEIIKTIFIPKKIRKRQYFLHEGEVCKYAGFIVKGAMRQYSIDDKGMEHVIHLFIENWWAVDRESYVMLTPSAYNIDAWEETDLLLVTRADFLNHLGTMDAISEMMRKLDENFAIAAQKRLNSSITLSTEQRYAELTRTYPEFLQRFPQHIIASYLGVTKETLSRVRKQSMKK